MSDELHTVARFANPIEAALARNALEAAGIRAVVNDEYTLTTDPMLVGALNFIKVQVSAADRERAADVLAAESVPPDVLTEAALAEAEPEPADAGDDDEAIPAESEGERLVRYAFRAAVMGILACPPLLHIYSLVLLLRVALVHGDLPPAANRRFYVAFLLDLAVLATAGLIVLNLLPY
jgi:Putative prokaryotic signal transducing protein